MNRNTCCDQLPRVGPDELLSEGVAHMDNGDHAAAIPVLQRALEGAFAFPVLTQLKVGAVEIQKTVVAASSATLRAIPPPPPLPEVEMPSPRQTVDGGRPRSQPVEASPDARSMGARAS